jgi:hypothetical protein
MTGKTHFFKGTLGLFSFIAVYRGELEDLKIQIFLSHAEGRIRVTANTCVRYDSRLYTQVTMQILSFDGTSSPGE